MGQPWSFKREFLVFFWGNFYYWFFVLRQGLTIELWLSSRPGWPQTQKSEYWDERHVPRLPGATYYWYLVQVHSTQSVGLWHLKAKSILGLRLCIAQIQQSRWLLKDIRFPSPKSEFHLFLCRCLSLSVCSLTCIWPCPKGRELITTAVGNEPSPIPSD